MALPLNVMAPALSTLAVQSNAQYGFISLGPSRVGVGAYIIFVIFSPHGTFLATIFLHTKSP